MPGEQRRDAGSESWSDSGLKSPRFRPDSRVNRKFGEIWRVKAALGVRGFPGLKNETWGTRCIGVHAFSDRNRAPGWACVGCRRPPARAPRLPERPIRRQNKRVVHFIGLLFQ